MFDVNIFYIYQRSAYLSTGLPMCDLYTPVLFKIPNLLFLSCPSRKMVQWEIQQTTLWCLGLQHPKCRYSKLNMQCWSRCLDITMHQIQGLKLVFKTTCLLSAGMLNTTLWNMTLKFGSWSTLLGIQNSAFILRVRHYWIPVPSSLLSCCRSLPIEAASQKLEFDSKLSVICFSQGNSAHSTWMMFNVLFNNRPNLLGT